MKSFLTLIFAVLAVASPAVDFAGTWRGTISVTTPDGRTETVPLWAEFKVNGTKLNGLARKAQ